MNYLSEISLFSIYYRTVNIVVLQPWFEESDSLEIMKWHKQFGFGNLSS